MDGSCGRDAERFKAPARRVEFRFAEPVYRHPDIDFRNVVFNPTSTWITNLGASVSNTTL
jgi:hypothetical protein